MKLEKIDLSGLNDIYALSVVQREFEKAINEKWKNKPPWQRYQKKLIQDLGVLDIEKECAIDLPQYEKLHGERNLYSIRHPKSKKNIRIIYTIVEDGMVILLVAFLEKNDGDYKNAISTAKQRLRWLYS